MAKGYVHNPSVPPGWSSLQFPEHEASKGITTPLLPSPPSQVFHQASQVPIVTLVLREALCE